MYHTLYRKYRPKNFDEVVGQKTIIQTLKNAIKNDTLNHAYLFTGPRGTGKTSIAKILAKAINCQNAENGNPCNNCLNCKQINDKQAIDILEIDAASNNGVDEIREIRNKVNLVPSLGKYKVYIVDEVHMLTTGAFNALLKTLEEPPSHIVFILATTEPHKIPATILSRCQRFDFKKISTEEMIPHLRKIVGEEQVEIEDSALKEVARLSDGCMRDALSILDQVIAYASNQIKVDDVHEVNGTLSQRELKNFIDNLIEQDYQKLFEMVDVYDNHGKNFIKLTEEIILFLRNVLLTIHVPEYFKKLDFDFELYKQISEKFDDKKIFDYLENFNKSISDMKKTSHSRIVFEMILIEIIQNETERHSDNTKISQLREMLPTNNEKTIVTKPEIVEKKIKEKSELIPKPKLNYEVQDIKKIRVNNTLCNFDKKKFKEMKNRIDEVRSLIIDPDYSEFASMIIDGDLRALGKENMIFVFDSERDSNQFNENIISIDSMLNDYFKTKYRTIAVTKEEWEKIKQEFNSKTIKYTYIEEPNILVDSGKDKDELEDLFGEIIEYL